MKSSDVRDISFVVTYLAIIFAVIIYAICRPKKADKKETAEKPVERVDTVPEKPWGRVMYTRCQSSKIYYSPTTAALVLKKLGANETVKADFKDGKWYAIFKPSERVRDMSRVVGYMEETDLFPAPLPPGPIEGGEGEAPAIASSVEGMKYLTPRQPVSYTPPPVAKITDNEYHRVIVRAESYLKTILKDPASYEGIEWSDVRKTRSGEFVVIHRYRSKNSFGGYTVETKVFTLNSEFKVTSCVSFTGFL